MNETTEKRPALARIGRWLAELVLVFVGVYAAFWLNNYQQHQQNLQRHDQILASLERRLNEGIESARDAGAKEDNEVAEFKRALAALRNLESVIRNGLAQIAHFQKLSDELIVPNLDQDISFFYDPATKKLRRRFAKYPDALAMTANFLHELEKAQTNLLKQIQAERQRR